MPKPDDRSDNVEKLQEMVQNTIGNLEESEEYLNEFRDQLPEREAEAIAENNDNRRQSIEGFRNEIKDEAHDDIV